MCRSPVTADSRAAPVLRALESYRGSIVDLTSELVVDAEALTRATRDVAANAQQRGLCAGDRVVMAIRNGPQFVVIWGSILSCGGSPLLLHVETPPAELHRVALDFGARFVVTDNCDLGGLAAALGANVVAWDLWSRVAWAELNDNAGFAHSDPHLIGTALHPTSGTTGRPKMAVRPWESAVADAEHYIETLGIEQTDTVLAAVPMSHLYGYGMCLMVPLLSGATVVTMRRFDPKLAHQAFRRYAVSVLPVAPVMLDLLMLDRREEWATSPRQVLSAGAPLPERIAREYHHRSGTAVRSVYGTTETGGISVAPESTEPWLGGGVGKPMRGVEIEVRASAGDLPEGVGRLHVRSSSAMAGYLGREQVERGCLRDGWFETGDLARVDSAGAIHLTGRETEVINVFGLKVVPSEVEAVISRIPGVVDAKVYAGAHRSGSQIVKAAIVSNGPLDTTSIRAHCEQHLAAFKRPEIIIQVESLPRSPSGKVLRDLLP